MESGVTCPDGSYYNEALGFCKLCSRLCTPGNEWNCEKFCPGFLSNADRSTITTERSAVVNASFAVREDESTQDTSSVNVQAAMITIVVVVVFLLCVAIVLVVVVVPKVKKMMKKKKTKQDIIHDEELAMEPLNSTGSGQQQKLPGKDATSGQGSDPLVPLNSKKRKEGAKALPDNMSMGSDSLDVHVSRASRKDTTTDTPAGNQESQGAQSYSPALRNGHVHRMFNTGRRKSSLASLSFPELSTLTSEVYDFRSSGPPTLHGSYKDAEYCTDLQMTEQALQQRITAEPGGGSSYPIACSDECMPEGIKCKKLIYNDKFMKYVPES